MTDMNNGGSLAAASTQCNNQEELDARLRALNNPCRGTRGESQQSVRRVQKSRLNVANDMPRALTFCSQLQDQRN